ncbi:THUMPD3 [Cordylochernes scorpioides]|uniref:THUMPD3 n=1 Tax=Cordylochernes scorpioides TaxID=51811 RepID=A0ABY6K810_9ARAC|nr:THUMPD3 [Cordylochernes scorpioides]
MKSIDNVFVVVKRLPHHNLSKDKEEALKQLTELVTEVEWETGLEAWLAWNLGCSLSLPQLLDQTQGGDKPTFRATCNRSGKSHAFTSMEAAAAFGGAVNDRFHWRIDLKNFDLEVVLNIVEHSLYVCLALTKESLHRRNLHHFGPTSLRATICYSLLRLGKIKPGEVVCDPMCGGGSISLEGALNWRDAIHLCGDNHELARDRTYQNILALNDQLRKEGRPEIQVEQFQWDVCRLPLRDHSVDVFVTDLPFGKRMGSKHDNRTLYPALLKEMARAAKPKSSRAVILTQDKVTFSKVILKTRQWFQAKVYAVNVGGLAACVFILHRTSVS